MFDHMFVQLFKMAEKELEFTRDDDFKPPEVKEEELKPVIIKQNSMVVLQMLIVAQPKLWQSTKHLFAHTKGNNHCMDS